MPGSIAVRYLFLAVGQAGVIRVFLTVPLVSGPRLALAALACIHFSFLFFTFAQTVFC